MSHWDRRPLEGARLRWEIPPTDRCGQERKISAGERRAAARRWSVVDAGLIEAQLPEEPGLVTVALWLLDGNGGIRARNYVNVDLYAGPLPAVERTEQGVALRFLPADFADSSWPQPALGP